MNKCSDCDKPLSAEEVRECTDICYECDVNDHIGRIAFHIQQGRILFEEVIRKIIYEVDN
jgi:hypothetical protein